MGDEANRSKGSVAEAISPVATVVLTILGLARVAPEFLIVIVTGVVLGIVALLGVNTNELTAIAVIAFGTALVLSSSSAMRLHLLRLSLTRPYERAQHLASHTSASEILSSSAGILGLAGLSTIVLEFLALAGFSPVVLVLIALLTLVSAKTLDGIEFTDARVSDTEGRAHRAVSAAWAYCHSLSTPIGFRVGGHSARRSTSNV